MLKSALFGYITDYLLWWAVFLSLIVHTWCFFRFFPRKRRRTSGLIIGNLLVFACMLGAVALVAETHLRFVAVETDPFGLSLPARRWFALHTRLNSLDCRDDEWTPEKPPGVRRIAFVGDSFTYGWGIERIEDRFPDRIQAKFDQVAPGTVEVMNVAKPGWDTGAELEPIQTMIATYGVDEVVLCYVPNDIEKLLPRTDDFDPVRPPEPNLFNPFSSALLEYLYQRIWVPRVATVSGYHDWLAEGFADEGIWRRHQEQSGAIISYCRDKDVALRVALLPFIRVGGEKLQPARLLATLGQFFEANGVAVVDLLAAIRGEDAASLVVSKSDAHPNERANELFAEAIWQTFYTPSTP